MLKIFTVVDSPVEWDLFVEAFSCHFASCLSILVVSNLDQRISLGMRSNADLKSIKADFRPPSLGEEYLHARWCKIRP